ncbi:MAG TPA: mechanosensitive ion channel domain-containing protein [Pyrinomonadaceae bacterium]|nr:mechanosensitive ion channel domain-containing protein [Pyrinomonadaceae bacterium]
MRTLLMEMWSHATWTEHTNASQMLLNHVLLWLQDDQNLLEYIWFYINRKFTIGNISVSVTSLATGIGFFLLALLVSRALQSFLQRRMAERAHIDPGIQYTIFRLAHYVIIALGVLYGLKAAFALDLTSLAVLFTALSVGIGFGLQFIAGDIASGFILLFERPVRVGDFITVNGDTTGEIQGKVQSINLRTTVVVTNDRLAVIVPNSKLVNQSLINWSYVERRARISIHIGVSYDSDVELVTRTLLRAAEGVKFVLADPKPSVQFLQFGESSLDFRLLVWTANPRRHPQIRSDINYRIRKLFLEEGIEIPFPQRDLHLRTGALVLDDGDGRLLAKERAAQEDSEQASDFPRG